MLCIVHDDEFKYQDKNNINPSIPSESKIVSHSVTVTNREEYNAISFGKDRFTVGSPSRGFLLK